MELQGLGEGTRGSIGDLAGQLLLVVLYYEVADTFCQMRSSVTSGRSSVKASVENWCGAHPSLVTEYWCQEDEVPVCQHCLIFGPHKSHTAVMKQQRVAEELGFLEDQRLAVEKPLHSCLDGLRAALAEVQSVLVVVRSEQLGAADRKELVSRVAEYFEQRAKEEEKMLSTKLVQQKTKLQAAIDAVENALFNTTTHSLDLATCGILLKCAFTVEVKSGSLEEDDSGCLVLRPPALLLQAGEENSCDAEHLQEMEEKQSTYEGSKIRRLPCLDLEVAMGFLTRVEVAEIGTPAR